MSLWDFLGEFAVFNMICNLFSDRSKSCRTSSYQPHYEYIPDPECTDRKSVVGGKRGGGGGGRVL